MFSRYRTKGIVIGKEDHGESSRMFTFYTEDFGKLKLFGKSIRKESSKLCSGAEPFSLIEVEFIQGRARKILTDIKVLNSYALINGDIEKIALGNKITEDLNDLIKGEEKDIEIWDLIQKTFSELNGSRKGFVVYQHFFWNLMLILGYGPELYRCSQCQGKVDPKKLIFSPEDGGLVCGSCSRKESSFSVEENTIKAIRIILKDIKNFERIKFDRRSKELLWNVAQKYLSLIGK